MNKIFSYLLKTGFQVGKTTICFALFLFYKIILMSSPVKTSHSLIKAAKQENTCPIPKSIYLSDSNSIWLEWPF